MYSTPLQHTPIDVATRWRQRIWRGVRSTIEKRFGEQGSRISNPQTFALNACLPGRYVLKLGRGHGDVARELKRKLCHVTSIDLGVSDRAKKSIAAPELTSAIPRLPDNVAWFDEILLLDLLDQVAAPDIFMHELRRKMARRGSEVIITTTNLVSLIRRILLVLGCVRGNRIGRAKNERRPFTFKSLRMLLEQAGYEIVETRGLPMPCPTAGASSRWNRAFIKLNRVLFKTSKHLFAHEICIRARPVLSLGQPARKRRSNKPQLYPSGLKRVA